MNAAAPVDGNVKFTVVSKVGGALGATRPIIGHESRAADCRNKWGQTPVPYFLEKERAF